MMKYFIIFPYKKLRIEVGPSVSWKFFSFRGLKVSYDFLNFGYFLALYALDSKKICNFFYKEILEENPLSFLFSALDGLVSYKVLEANMQIFGITFLLYFLKLDGQVYCLSIFSFNAHFALRKYVLGDRANRTLNPNR